jgi:hypothetical protein
MYCSGVVKRDMIVCGRGILLNGNLIVLVRGSCGDSIFVIVIVIYIYI